MTRMKNTIEVLSLGKIVTLAILAEVKKDGFQIADLGAFLKTDEFHAAVKPAMDDIDQVDDELIAAGPLDWLFMARAAYSDCMEVVEFLQAWKSGDDDSGTDG